MTAWGRIGTYERPAQTGHKRTFKEIEPGPLRNSSKKGQGRHATGNPLSGRCSSVRLGRRFMQQSAKQAFPAIRTPQTVIPFR